MLDLRMEIHKRKEQNLEKGREEQGESNAALGIFFWQEERNLINSPEGPAAGAVKTFLDAEFRRSFVDDAIVVALVLIHVGVPDADLFLQFTCNQSFYDQN